MTRHRLMRGPRIAAIAALSLIVLLLVTLVIMSLWNALLPALFGWPAISFWQAMGLMFLSRLLLGGFPRGPGRHLHWRHRMMERWQQMTPEERERFSAGMRGRCGHFEPPPEAAKPTA
jgi:hypothetical protein